MATTEVAIVHDYLNQRGGAERVVLEMLQMWPSAPLYTSLYRPESTLPGFKEHDIRTSFLDRLPVDRGFRNLFPLYPAAFKSFGEIDAKVVLASSSGWAHLARVNPDALHVVYCYTPARWLYQDEHLSVNRASSIPERVVGLGLRPFRHLDRRAAQRADCYIAISEHVRQRVKATYGIEADMVPPPVDTERFRPSPRGDRLLTVSRLLPYKHVGLLVRAATRVGIGFDVVGDGPELADLRRIAGPNVTFHGGISDEAVIELVQECRAVCVAAEEDFGLVAVEAHAAGKPVVAFGRGGALETVEDGVTGVLFSERTEESVIAALKICDRLDASPEMLAAEAQKFSRQTFQRRLSEVLDAQLGQRVAAS